MNDFNDNHEPTPEFRASLDREIIRAFHRDHGTAAHRRTRRIGKVIGLVLGAVIMLTVGVVMVNTGYASARVEGDRQRSEIAGTMIDVMSQLSVLRLDLERAHHDLVQLASKSGTVPRRHLFRPRRRNCASCRRVRRAASSI